MLSIVIEGYLTEVKLAEAVRALVSDSWLGDQIKEAGSRLRWDMSFQTAVGVTVVEYDGDEHYRHSMKIRADRTKDELALARGYHVVRFPYWVQLDAETLEFYFGLQAVIEQSFPHGFITTKLFPASFCELGVARFHTELLALPARVKNAVLSSLEDRAREYGLEYVLPAPLNHLIAKGAPD